jgi:parallel beta-helix repeat protein
MPGEPAAFMSYVRFDDEHDDGQLTTFQQRLSGEIRVQTGGPFMIFQDRNDIAWGQNWQQRIDETLDAVTLLLVIITPGLFRSPACRAEVTRFLERERELGRADLILPVYYVGAEEMDDPILREKDELAKVLTARQYVDWRELRFEPFTSPITRKAVAQLAARMRDTFWQSPAPPTPTAGREQQTDRSPTETAGKPDTTSRTTAKTEPPIRIVDAYGRGDFTTVGEAIRSADPGDRIMVRPGLYEEGLAIDKPLEILGDGPLADIVVRARDADAVIFGASIGRVSNLTLRQSGDEEGWYGVDITQGRLDLEGCDISSLSGACVAIRDGADPRLRRNKIHDGIEIGVFVYDNGLGTLEDNDISGNAAAGVAIGSGGNPTLRANRIHDGKDVGVYIYDDAKGTLEDNDISGNAAAGVFISAGSDPVLRRNQIRDGKKGGVLVFDNGLGTLEDNDITGNATAAVQISTGGNPTLRANKIHDGKDAGVSVFDNGLGTLEDNDITGNKALGVAIATGGDPTLRANRINDNKGAGVSVFDNGLGTLEDNDITGNATAAVQILTGSNPTLRANRINDNKDAGVSVFDNGLGTLEDNDISGNALVGVYIAGGGNPTVRANRINRNHHEAVWIRDGGCGVIEDNNLTGNGGRGAWDLADDCVDKVTRARNEE